jgi:hypothetical protein
MPSLTVRAASISWPRIPLLRAYGQPRCRRAHAQSFGGCKCDTAYPPRRHRQGAVREGVLPHLVVRSTIPIVADLGAEVQGVCGREFAQRRSRRWSLCQEVRQAGRRRQDRSRRRRRSGSVPAARSCGRRERARCNSGYLAGLPQRPGL